MKLPANVKAAAEPYQAALNNLQSLDLTLAQLRHKKSVLEKEIELLNERRRAHEQSRPGLLESVLAGAQPESALTEQEVEVTRLRAEQKSKEELLVLIEAQMANKSKARIDGNARMAPMRGRIFGAIQEDLVATMPKDFLPYITKLAAVASMNHQTWPSIIEGLMPQRRHDDWEKELNRILEEYGIPTH